MATKFLSLLLSLLSLSSLPLPSLSSGETFIYGSCSQIKFTLGTPYESNLNSLLASMVNSATYSSYNKFTITGSSPQDVVYGLYQCQGDMSMPECATCVAHSVSRLGQSCQQTCGGAVQLEGCFVKYDNICFIGEEDKEVVEKKCAPSIGDGTDLIDRRDAVLASLGGAGGLYRVGGAGDVQGVAQCTGDLSVSECQDCVTEAIGRLKSECASAVFGDMFLGKCYARYSTSGSHINSESCDDDSHDDAEKTFAIIIGLFASVVALIISFLTIMRRVFGGNGQLRINIDGGMDEWNRGNFGGLVRDEKGKWIEGFYGMIGSATVLKAELWAIRFALYLCKEKNWAGTPIETDSLVACKLINEEEENDRLHQDRVLITDCRNLMEELNTAVIHISREENKCADFLAKMGSNQNERTVKLIVPPEELMQQLIDDAEGNTSSRFM